MRLTTITGVAAALLSLGLQAAAADPSVRVVLLQGHETIFSAGNDIGDFLHRLCELWLPRVAPFHTLNERP